VAHRGVLGGWSVSVSIPASLSIVRSTAAASVLRAGTWTGTAPVGELEISPAVKALLQHVQLRPGPFPSAGPMQGQGMTELRGSMPTPLGGQASAPKGVLVRRTLKAVPVSAN
jgi:hypothetical protein